MHEYHRFRIEFRFLIRFRSCYRFFLRRIDYYEVEIHFQTGKLNEAERKELLEPLLAKGWTLVNGRDAIYKEFLFKDFNQAIKMKCTIFATN